MEKVVTAQEKKKKRYCLPEDYHAAGCLERLPWKHSYKSGLAVNSISVITESVGVTRM